MAAVELRLVEDVGERPETSRPRDAEWAVHDSSPYPGKESTLIFVCPCGCGALSAVHVSPIDKHPVWSWDGNREKPTLNPSILRTAGCKWHGWLRAGVFVPA